MKKKYTRPRIGLALGSGGSKGLAHIGVLRALSDHNIPIDMIAGSSVGALIGGLYASGRSVEEIEKISWDANWRMMFSMVDPKLKRGLIGGKKVKEFIRHELKAQTFETCPIPFSAIGTNMQTGAFYAFTSGDMATAIRASISVPVAFKSEEIDGHVYADGGLSAPVPVETLRQMGADIVIAVNLDKHYYNEKKKPAWYTVAYDSLNILRYHLALQNVEDADVVIDIDTHTSDVFDFFNFVDGEEKIAIGKRAAEDILPELERVIAERMK
ncbi:MAG: patatin family protein [Candidatus Yonathbacteria bacterium]|nr:patatin family protein [Candidatus Yonathbacteria bacterium]